MTVHYLFFPVLPSQFMVLSHPAVDKYANCELKNYSEILLLQTEVAIK